MIHLSIRSARRVTAAFMVLCAAYGTPAFAQGAASDQVLRVGLAVEDVGTLNPHAAVGIGDTTLVNQIFEGLVAFPPGKMNPADLRPSLAERWESTPDRKAWIFHLRKGVKWHGPHGEFTADDVKFSIDLVRDPKRASPFRSTFENIESVQVIGPHEARVLLKQPDPNFLQLVANFQAGYMVSKRAIESGIDVRTAAIGTGPFKLAAYNPRESVILDAHDEYWGGKPVLRRIVQRFMADQSARELALRAGEVHAIGINPRQDVVDRLRRAGFLVDLTTPANAFFLQLNVTKKPLDDIRVRRALAHATNRDKLVEFMGRDIAKPEVSALSDIYVGNTQDVRQYPYDVARSKALLSEAGFPNGLTMQIVISSINLYLPVMQVIQDQWKQAGVNLEMQVVDHPTFHRLIRENASPVVMYGAHRYPLTGRIMLQQFYARESIVGKPTAATNFIHYGDAMPGVDDLLSEAAYNPDPARQVKLWQDAQRKIAEDAVAIPMYTQKYSMARSKSIDLGFTQESFAFYRFSEKTRLDAR